MKKLTALVIATVTAAFAGDWTEYPLEIPPTITSVGRIAVNDAREGYAFTGGPHSVVGPLLSLEGAGWKLLSPPPVNMAYPSLTRDGTLYAVDDASSRSLWRFLKPDVWERVATPGEIGMVKFVRVVGVGPNDFWVLGGTTDCQVVAAHYSGGGPRDIYHLGRYSSSQLRVLGDLAVPRAENPGLEAYVALQTLENGIWPAKWVLAVLKPDGRYSFYPIPRGDEAYHVDGFVAYRPGEVRVGMVKNGAAGPTYIYAFENGRFTEIAYYAERVVLKCYVTPADGWGTSYTNKVYHWTTSGPGEFYTLSGTVNDLGMVDVNDGWAGGYKRLPGGETKAIMWHYTGNPAVTPTSLGRVKAMFR